MQQRFCACGCSVWVHYQFCNMACRVIFRSSADTMKDRLSRCPCCGKQLAIADLYLYQPFLLHSRQMKLLEYWSKWQNRKFITTIAILLNTTGARSSSVRETGPAPPLEETGYYLTLLKKPPSIFITTAVNPGRSISSRTAIHMWRHFLIGTPAVSIKSFRMNRFLDKNSLNHPPYLPKGSPSGRINNGWFKAVVFFGKK